jgi:hypothetical protein
MKKVEPNKEGRQFGGLETLCAEILGAFASWFLGEEFDGNRDAEEGD